MRQTKWGRELQKRIFFALAAVALASPAWASIGVPHNTLYDYTRKLRSLGWEVDTQIVVVVGNNQAKLEKPVNQLIGQVLKKFSEKDADKVTLEIKRDISRITNEAIARGMVYRKNSLKTGITGSLRYRVCLFEYKTYYGPGTGRQAREEWERKGVKDEQSGLALVIALMPKERVRRAEAQITVRNLPADAELLFDGERTTQKGSVRHYTTPKLEVGRMYSYKIFVCGQKDGKTYERSGTVSMSGGDDDIEVNFRHLSGSSKD